MDFIDYRKTPHKLPSHETKQAEQNRYHGRRFFDYVGEQIREAQERGDFEKLPGFGKPLSFDDDFYAGDRGQGYRLLKSNGYAPYEVELLKEIRQDVKRLEARLARLQQQGRRLRERRVPPFPSEKRAYNAALAQMSAEYAVALREINRKILTLNISAPALMHRPMFEVEQLVQDFHAANPPL